MRTCIQFVGKKKQPDFTPGVKCGGGERSRTPSKFVKKRFQAPGEWWSNGRQEAQDSRAKGGRRVEGVTRGKGSDNKVSQK